MNIPDHFSSNTCSFAAPQIPLFGGCKDWTQDCRRTVATFALSVRCCNHSARFSSTNSAKSITVHLALFFQNFHNFCCLIVLNKFGMILFKSWIPYALIAKSWMPFRIRDLYVFYGCWMLSEYCQFWIRIFFSRMLSRRLLLKSASPGLSATMRGMATSGPGGKLTGKGMFHWQLENNRI